MSRSFPASSPTQRISEKHFFLLRFQSEKKLQRWRRTRQERRKCLKSIFYSLSPSFYLLFMTFFFTFSLSIFPSLFASFHFALISFTSSLPFLLFLVILSCRHQRHLAFLPSSKHCLCECVSASPHFSLSCRCVSRYACLSLLSSSSLFVSFGKWGHTHTHTFICLFLVSLNIKQKKFFFWGG